MNFAETKWFRVIVWSREPVAPLSMPGENMLVEHIYFRVFAMGVRDGGELYLDTEGNSPSVVYAAGAWLKFHSFPDDSKAPV